MLEALATASEELLKDANAWFGKSDVLRRAGDILDEAYKAAVRHVIHLSTAAAAGTDVSRDLPGAQKDTNLHAVSQMLYQLSMENALKGIAVKQGKEPLRSHDLVELAKAAGIVLEAGEESKLKVLNRMNELGRYRVGGSEKKGYTHGTVGFNNMDKLYESIWNKIRKAAQ